MTHAEQLKNIRSELQGYTSEELRDIYRDAKAIMLAVAVEIAEAAVRLAE